MFHIYTISFQKGPTYLESARIGEMGSPRLVKLDKAARRLGCHVETLRVHIRTGRLGLKSLGQADSGIDAI